MEGVIEGRAAGMLRGLDCVCVERDRVDGEDGV
jgi:hypothetical protein